MEPGFLLFPWRRLVIGPDDAGRSAASGKVSLIRSNTAAVSLWRHMDAWCCPWRHPKLSLEGVSCSSFCCCTASSATPPSLISPLSSDRAAECVCMWPLSRRVSPFYTAVALGCQGGSGERRCSRAQRQCKVPPPTPVRGRGQK